MADHFTETTTRSWSSRIGGSLKGILVGFILVLAAFPLLWWNEGRAIDRTQTLETGRKTVVAVESDRLDPAREGQLIHIAGLATTEEVLSDPLFDLSLSAIKLRRQVEMYQWVEESRSTTTKNVGGSETTETTYDYRRNWSERWIDSSRFKHPADHANPPSMPYASETKQASRVKVGAFNLAPVFVTQINPFQALPITQKGRVPEGFELHGGGYYQGSPTAPRVGDLRVSFSVVEPSQVSLIGRQAGRGIETARLPKGQIALLELGRVDATTMFDHADTANRFLTWAIRAGGLLLLWIGFGMILAPLKVLADVVPFIGRLVGAGTGLIAALLAVALGALTIAIAWVLHRPLLAGLLLALAVVALAIGAFRMRSAPRTPRAPGVAG
ncbi:TMEM43 family protein [Thiocystis violacea]|uniref:TMEM43 family protein n=1 Tax=Thiocystis violacea TaxID=13725 RepID=UPI001907EB82|nr:TMEM43 family protein [Thiocystis violacea]MBK1720148.1 hypothetical protein [Thiocystis violacea]